MGEKYNPTPEEEKEIQEKIKQNLDEGFEQWKKKIDEVPGLWEDIQNKEEQERRRRQKEERESRLEIPVPSPRNDQEQEEERE